MLVWIHSQWNPLMLQCNCTNKYIFCISFCLFVFENATYYFFQNKIKQERTVKNCVSYCLFSTSRYVVCWPSENCQTGKGRRISFWVWSTYGVDSPIAWILLHLLRGGHENYCQPLWLLITWSCTFVSFSWMKCPFHPKCLLVKSVQNFRFWKHYYEVCHQLGCDTMQCGRHLAAFWRITLSAASDLYVDDTGSICLQNFSKFFVFCGGIFLKTVIIKWKGN